MVIPIFHFPDILIPPWYVQFMKDEKYYHANVRTSSKKTLPCEKGRKYQTPALQHCIM